MRTAIIAISAILIIGSITPFVNAEGVPEWVKNNAGWWADGSIDDNSFVQGIQFLIKEGIMTIPPTTQGTATTDKIPEWVKNNAGWWADGSIDDNSFVQGIQFLIKEGIMRIPLTTESPKAVDSPKTTDDTKLASLESELAKCKDIVKAYERLNCEKVAKHHIEAYKIKTSGQSYKVGPLTYYWAGLGTDGSSFEVTETGQAILSVRILAEHTGSADNVSMMCTGPSICNYDVWNGDKAFKYSGMDFTNGQIVLKPGESAIFNMLFGPNIGYGGTKFEYDPSKDYYFRISEPFGSASIPLNIE